MSVSDDFATSDRAYWRSLRLHKLDGTIVLLPLPTAAALTRAETKFKPTSVPITAVRDHRRAYDDVRKAIGLGESSVAVRRKKS